MYFTYPFLKGEWTQSALKLLLWEGQGRGEGDRLGAGEGGLNVQQIFI